MCLIKPLRKPQPPQLRPTGAGEEKSASNLKCSIIIMGSVMRGTSGRSSDSMLRKKKKKGDAE